jgi:EpsI family protein
MFNWKKNRIVFGLYLILSLGAIQGVYGFSYRSSAPLQSHIPKIEFSQWESKEIESSYYEKALLNTGQLNKRIYFKGNDFVWYVMVKSLKGHHGQHKPEVCYTGNGWSVEEKEIRQIERKGKLINVTEMHLKRKGESRLVFYWYENGNLTTGNYYKRVLQHVWDDFTKTPYSSWTFNRISTPVIGNSENSRNLIQAFINKIELKKEGKMT